MDSLYLIGEGVRRAVAARELGLIVFPAVVLDRDGHFGPQFDVPLVQLYSSKATIVRVDGNQRYLRVERAMVDPVLRAILPAIELRIISPRQAKYLIRLMDVVLE